MVFKERFTAQACLRFLRRLVRQADRKVMLIVNRHPVHRSAKVKRWLVANHPAYGGGRRWRRDGIATACPAHRLNPEAPGWYTELFG